MKNQDNMSSLKITNFTVLAPNGNALLEFPYKEKKIKSMFKQLKEYMNALQENNKELMK